MQSRGRSTCDIPASCALYEVLANEWRDLADQIDRFNRSERSRLCSMVRGDSTRYLEESVRVHFLALFLCVCAGAVAAEQNRPPRLIAMGCNFDGGLTWLALGKARAGSELDSFRVEIPDVDLERVDATISPSNMDMFMPYGQGPVVGPINVSRISIGPRTVDGVANGNVVTVHFNILSSYSTPTDFLEPDAISYILILNNKSTGCPR